MGKRTKTPSYLRIVELGFTAQQQFSDQSLNPQLKIPFMPSLSQFCYSVDIRDFSLFNVQGFGQFGYSDHEFRSLYDLEQKIHESTRFRYVFQASAGYQYIAKSGLSLSTLSELIYQIFIYFKDSKGVYFPVFLTSQLLIEQCPEGPKIIGNRTVGHKINQPIELNDDNIPLDLIIQKPSITRNGWPMQEIESYVLAQVNALHLDRLNFTETERRVLTLLANKKSVSQISKELYGPSLKKKDENKKLYRVRAHQKSIVGKSRVEWAFETAAQAARHYRKYAMI